jgi:hypothetical protein
MSPNPFKVYDAALRMEEDSRGVNGCVATPSEFAKLFGAYGVSMVVRSVIVIEAQVPLFGLSVRLDDTRGRIHGC